MFCLFRKQAKILAKTKRPRESTKNRQPTIPQRAQAQNLSISAYVKKPAKECKILYRDFPKIAEHSRYVADIRDHINNISFTIEVMNNYQDRQIESVVNYMQALAGSEEKLLETLKEQLKQAPSVSKKRGQETGFPGHLGGSGSRSRNCCN